MKRSILYVCVLMLASAVSAQMPQRSSPQQSIEDFWKKFQTAVVKGDKETVVALSALPIQMPYGMKAIRNRAQFMKEYRHIFFSEGDAAQCFPKAKPYSDPKKPNVFEIGCSMTGGNTEEEPLVYRFKRGPNGWRFTGFDNINE